MTQEDFIEREIEALGKLLRALLAKLTVKYSSHQGINLIEEEPEFTKLYADLRANPDTVLRNHKWSRKNKEILIEILIVSAENAEGETMRDHAKAARQVLDEMEAADDTLSMRQVTFSERISRLLDR